MNPETETVIHIPINVIKLASAVEIEVVAVDDVSDEDELGIDFDIDTDLEDRRFEYDGFNAPC